MNRLTVAHLLADLAVKPSIILASVAGTTGCVGLIAHVPTLSVLAAVLLVVAALPFMVAWLLGWRT